MKSKSDPAVDLLLEALKTYSVSTKEEKLSKLLRERMRQRGFKNVRTDKAGNAIGEVGSGHPHVLLCGHMDTVPGFLKVRVEGDRVYGRGAADAKSPMCAMISAASALASAPRGDEGHDGLRHEGGGGQPRGRDAHRVGRGLRLCGLRRARGRGEGHRRVPREDGREGHGGDPRGARVVLWAHPSAVDESLAIMSLIKDYERKNTVEGNHFKSLSASLTLIRGGAYSNVIPKRCQMTFDVRIPPGMKSSRVKEDLAAVVEGYARMNGGVDARVEFDGSTEPYDAPLDSVVVRAFQRSILKTLERAPRADATRPGRAT